MIVEVRGANTRNKGAELMLRSIVHQLQGDHRVAVGPRSGSYEERARMGLMQKVEHSRVPAGWLALAARSLPGKARRHARAQYGLVFEPDVGALLDASGFAYSDQFDLKRSAVAAERVERAKRSGQRVILMPQAFGPFKLASRRDAFRRIADGADLVYARDRTSLDHVLGTGSRNDHVRLAPDFTCLLDGALPPGVEMTDRRALIVPSAKILAETTEEIRDAYLPFLASAVEILRSMDIEVSILQHERGDGPVIAALQERLPVRAPEISFECPLHLKGVIGRARILVGSRFHALVSALSQGVPALAVGWSHKYEMLFADYSCPERVVQPTIAGPELRTRLRELVEEPARSELVASLQEHAEIERARAREMWAEVRSLLAAA